MPVPPFMLNILYRDDTLIAIDKPSGLLVHRSLIDKHETRFAIQLLRDQIGQRVYPLHRLDKPTSGVLLFALTEESARARGAVRPLVRGLSARAVSRAEVRGPGT